MALAPEPALPHSRLNQKGGYRTIVRPKEGGDKSTIDRLVRLLP